MSRKPLISILTPVFNQSSFIEKTIQSVLGQTYREWEWIILDDGSTDGTGDVVTRVRDSRIKYSFQKHAGVQFHTKTYNTALAMCEGDFIAMLDGDDYWPPHKLATQVPGFEDPGIILSYGESFLVDRKGRKRGYVSLPEDPRTACNSPVGSALKIFLVDKSCFIACPTVVVRKSALSSIGGFIEAKDMGQDYPTWVTLSLEGRFAALPTCVGYYRKHVSSTSLRRAPERSFSGETDFLREFIVQNRKRLNDLGLYCDGESIEKHWEALKAYIPYNHALSLLMLDSFMDAKTAFEAFLECRPSPKARLVYALIQLSGLVKYDIVNPAATAKEKLRRIFRRS